MSSVNLSKNLPSGFIVSIIGTLYYMTDAFGIDLFRQKKGKQEETERGEKKRDACMCIRLRIVS
jgi:hypothetical protein